MGNASPRLGTAEIQSPVLDPQMAWQPLPATQWDENAARHLLRRAAWTAQPDDVTRAIQEGLPATLARLFPAAPVAFPKPKLITTLQEDTPDFAQRVRATLPEEKRLLQKEARDRSQQALFDLAIRWLQFAALPEHSAAEKWTLFLSDVFVVSSEKVRNAALVCNHFETLRNHSFGPAPTLTKAVSRSPAMVQYLDLQESRRNAPNENFARELFELFLVGESNYTEKDIKEAAKAFTGYRQRFGEFNFVPNQHDPGHKTVFGHTGNFTGDQVIDLAYQLPAAGAFLPGEMARFYLSDEPLPKDLLASIGTWWREQGYSLQALTHRFFGSRLFFDLSYRANYIKSPVQLYLGLVQDLQLDVPPLPRRVLGSFRQMGQTLFAPPNVRGWVGGRNWINASTLNARRLLVQSLFSPINEANLNADELAEIANVRATGHDHFSMEPERLKSFSGLTAEQLADRLIDSFLPTKVDDSFRREVRQFLADDSQFKRPIDRIRNAAVTLLQSPEYQLC